MCGRNNHFLLLSLFKTQIITVWCHNNGRNKDVLEVFVTEFGTAIMEQPYFRKNRHEIQHRLSLLTCQYMDRLNKL